VVTYDPRDNSREEAPVTYNYNLTLEHQFPQAVLARLAYVGSQLRHQTETVELNPAAYIPGSTLSDTARRPFQPYGSIGQGTQDVIGNYNALQLTLQRRLNTLTVLANYTYSKDLDDMPAGQGNAGISSQSDSKLPATNPLRQQFDYGRSDFGRRIMTASYVVGSTAIGEAESAGQGGCGRLADYRDRHLSEWPGYDAVGRCGPFADRPLRRPCRTDCSERLRRYSMRGYNIMPQLLEPQCICDKLYSRKHPLGIFGNTGKGGFDGPQYWDFDAGLLKNWAVVSSDRVHVQFHAEFFNVLNHTQLGNPNLTANAQGFGSITGLATNASPRVGQLALKLLF
jgi:hypothetical protein